MRNGSCKYTVKSTCCILHQYLRDNARLVLMCMLIGIMHMLYQGYRFGEGNHAIQLPLLKSYFHSKLYPNDPMVATRSHFITFYFIFLAAIERLFGHLEFIFFTAQLITEVHTSVLSVGQRKIGSAEYQSNICSL